jgi:group I intron endonuclease
MPAGVVYIVTNLVNGKYYVGMTTWTPDNRFEGHVYDAEKGADQLFSRAIRKYGKQAFLVETLGVAETKQDLAVLERLWIQLLRPFDVELGYNMTYGGEGFTSANQIGKVVSIETRRRQSEVRTKVASETPIEVRRALTEAARKASPFGNSDFARRAAEKRWGKRG